MPEAIVRITNNALVKGEIKKLTAELELPAPKEQIDRILGELQISMGKRDE